jgi:hypothetical protein
LCRLVNTIMKPSGSSKALLASLGINLNSQEVRELIKPVNKSDISSDWVTHTEKTANGVAAEATDGGAEWEDIAGVCVFQGSQNPVVFIEVVGPPPVSRTAWFVYEQVPSDKNASALGATPCGEVDWDNIKKQPTGTWECKGR